MKVTLLYFDDCPNWEITNSRLESLATEIGFDFDRQQITTPEAAERLKFRGSPTVLVDGKDVFAAGGAPIGLSCRMYRTEGGLAGSPSERQLREAIAHGHVTDA